MGKGSIIALVLGAAILCGVTAAFAFLIALNGTEKLARVSIKSTEPFVEDWVLVRQYGDPKDCEARLLVVGRDFASCRYAPRWRVWLWQAEQSFRVNTGLVGTPPE
jgi:hypothetical protein